MRRPGLKLLDTNVVIHFLKGDPDVVANVRRAAPGELGIPTIVVYELEYGTLRSKLPTRRRRQLEEGLSHLEQIPFDTDAALAAAAIRIDLEGRRSKIGPLDILIAGIAMSRGAAFVTNNVAEFSRVPGLRVVDWKSGAVA